MVTTYTQCCKPVGSWWWPSVVAALQPCPTLPYLALHAPEEGECVAVQVNDSSIPFMPRTEVLDARSGAHLGAFLPCVVASHSLLVIV